MIIIPDDVKLVSELRGGTFTGEVWATPMKPGGDGVTIATVSFAPQARTHWHTHERGQILLVVSGSGLICSWGEQPRRLRPGDVVWVPPGERHWHGGSATAAMTHIAISLGTTKWGESVSDEDYEAGET